MTLSVRFVWTDEVEKGRELLDEIRAVAPVILDDADLKPYAAIDSVHADPVDPMPVVDPAMLLTEFTAETAERLLEVGGYGSESPQIMLEVRQLGGAYAREGEHPDAFSHRAAGFSVLAVGIAMDPRVMPHWERLYSALSDWDTGGIWPNFGAPHDAQTARRAYDDETLRRIVAVSRKYDPDGVLQIGEYARAVAR
jgi:hypothetical protein